MIRASSNTSSGSVISGVWPASQPDLGSFDDAGQQQAKDYGDPGRGALLLQQPQQRTIKYWYQY